MMRSLLALLVLASPVWTDARQQKLIPASWSRALGIHHRGNLIARSETPQSLDSILAIRGGADDAELVNTTIDANN